MSRRASRNEIPPIPTHIDKLLAAAKDIRKECKPTRFRVLAADKSNYLPWSAFLETTLKNLQPECMRLDMWNVLNDSLTDEEQAYLEDDDDDSDAQKEHIIIIRLLEHIVMCSIHDSHFVDLRDAENVVEWMYEAKPVHDHTIGDMLQQQMQQQTTDNFTSMLDYCRHMRSLYVQVQQCDDGHAIVNKRQFLRYLLNGIHDEHYHYEVDQLFSQMQTDIHFNFDVIKNALVSKEMRLKQRGHEARKVEVSNDQQVIKELQAQVAQLQSSFKSAASAMKKKNKKKKNQCSKCKRFGHNAAQCHQNKPCKRCLKHGHSAAKCRAPAPADDDEENAHYVSFMAFIDDHCPELVDSSDDSGLDEDYEEAPDLVSSSDDSDDSDDDGGDCPVDQQHLHSVVSPTALASVSTAQCLTENSTQSNCSSETFILDSGASIHMIDAPIHRFGDVKLDNSKVGVASKEGGLKATHKGSLIITLIDTTNKQPCQVKLNPVLRVPGLSQGLLSVRQIVSKVGGSAVRFGKRSATITVGRKVFSAALDARMGLYVLQGQSDHSHHGLISHTKKTHQRMFKQEQQTVPSDLSIKRKKDKTNKLLKLTQQQQQTKLKLNTNNNTKTEVVSDKQTQDVRTLRLSNTHDVLAIHRALGHPCLARMKKLVPLMPCVSKSAAAAVSSADYIDCGDCLQAKGLVTSSPKQGAGITPVNRPGALVSADTAGPFEGQLGGHKHLSILVDHYSNYIFLRRLRSLTATRIHIYDVNASLLNTTGYSFGVLRSDNGTEYCNQEVDAFCKNKGILRQMCVPHKHSQNGKAERTVRTVTEGGLANLLHSRLPYSFLFLATQCFVDTYNVLPRAGSRAPASVYPAAQSPSGIRLLPFGCLVRPVVPKELRRKHKARTEEGIFVGYDSATRGGYLVYRPTTKQIVTRDNVNPDESSFPGLPTQSSHPHVHDPSPDSDSDDPLPHLEPSLSGGDRHNDAGEQELEDDDDMEDPGGPVASREELNHWYGEWEHDDHKDDADEHGLLASRPALEGTPDQGELTWKAAMKSPDAQLWEQGARRELQSHFTNKTFSFTYDRPEESLIGSRWVLKEKVSASGEVTHKVRMVAQGFSQVQGVHFQETYAPTVASSTTRLLFAAAAQEGWSVEQMDVETAYLIPTLPEQERVVVRPPPDFVRLVNSLFGFDLKPGVLLSLLKAIYGLRQAAHYWNNEITTKVIHLGMQRTDADPCLFTKFDDAGKLILIIAIHVDDILLAGVDGELDSMRKRLSAAFPMKHLGSPQIFCGVQVIREGRHLIGIHQASYIKGLLRRFGFADARPVPVPTASARLECTRPSTAKERAAMQDVPYREAVGCLLWLATNTRPDIAFAVHQVARCVSDPRPSHWTAVKRIYRYLQGTTSLGLRYDGSRSEPVLETFSDSDWAGDSTRRTTSSSFIAVLGTPVRWRVRLLKSVALSSMEAELMALSEAGKETITLLKVFDAMGGLNRATPSIIRIDNDSARQALDREFPTPASRHIEVRHFWMRQHIKDGLFQVTRVPSEDNIADIGTKPVVPAEHFKKLTAMMMHHFSLGK